MDDDIILFYADPLTGEPPADEFQLKCKRNDKVP